MQSLQATLQTASYTSQCLLCWGGCLLACGHYIQCYNLGQILLGLFLIEIGGALLDPRPAL